MIVTSFVVVCAFGKLLILKVTQYCRTYIDRGPGEDRGTLLYAGGPRPWSLSPMIREGFLNSFARTSSSISYHQIGTILNL